MQKGISEPGIGQQLAPELRRRFFRTGTLQLTRDVGNNLIAGHGPSSQVGTVGGLDVKLSCPMDTLLCGPSRPVVRVLVDHGDEPRDGIAETGRRGGESWCTVCVRPMGFPLSPLLVQVLFPDARTP